jgi:hypothetical protein
VGVMEGWVVLGELVQHYPVSATPYSRATALWECIPFSKPTLTQSCA